MDLASGNYPLTPQDFASFDQCGRWHSAAHPPYSLDEDVGQEENCGDLACWYSTGDDAFYGDLYFDVCGCCDPTHINTDLSENCSYF